MKGGIPMNTGNPKIISLDLTACCALKEGFEKNQNIMLYLNQSFNPAVVIFCQNMLSKFTDIQFRGDNMTAEIFSIIAEAEKKRIQKKFAENNKFEPDCNLCSAVQHLKALDRVLELLGSMEPAGHA